MEKLTLNTQDFFYFLQEDIEICDDWADLIEYVIQKFISTIGSRPHAYASNLLECINNSEAVDENGFTRSQLDHLYSYYTQFEDAPDPVECVIGKKWVGILNMRLRYQSQREVVEVTRIKSLTSVTSL